MKTQLKISLDPSNKEQVSKAYEVLRALMADVQTEKTEGPAAFKLEKPKKTKPAKEEAKESKPAKEEVKETKPPKEEAKESKPAKEEVKETKPAKEEKTPKKGKESTANKLNTIRELVARNQQTNRAQMVGWLKDNDFEKVANIPEDSYDSFIEFLSSL